MTENLATAVEQNSTAIEQMSRSVQAVAQSGAPHHRRGARRGDERHRDGALDPVGRGAGAGGPTR